MGGPTFGRFFLIFLSIPDQVGGAFQGGGTGPPNPNPNPIPQMRAETADHRKSRTAVVAVVPISYSPPEFEGGSSLKLMPDIDTLHDMPECGPPAHTQTQTAALAHAGPLICLGLGITLFGGMLTDGLAYDSCIDVQPCEYTVCCICGGQSACVCALSQRWWAFPHALVGPPLDIQGNQDWPVFQRQHSVKEELQQNAEPVDTAQLQGHHSAREWSLQT